MLNRDVIKQLSEFRYSQTPNDATLGDKDELI